jgi:excisionase family DNA binding protein
MLRILRNETDARATALEAAVSSALPTTHRALTVPEVMDALNLSRFKVYDLIRSRQLLSIKIGRSRRVPADALRTFIEHQLEEAA